MALVALAQSGKGPSLFTTTWTCCLNALADVSIEQVAALSQNNTLPEPALDLDSIQPSTGASNFVPPVYRQNSTIRAPVPAYADDPWNSNPNTRFTTAPVSPGTFDSRSVLTTGAPSTLSGSGLPKDWWKQQESVTVTIVGQQGFILNRYTVYEVKSDVGFFTSWILCEAEKVYSEVQQSQGVIPSLHSYGTVF